MKILVYKRPEFSLMSSEGLVGVNKVARSGLTGLIHVCIESEHILDGSDSAKLIVNSILLWLFI
jgi:hypothetical protein